MVEDCMSRLAGVRSISGLWVGSILGAGFAFLSQVVLARSLGATAFGYFSAALTLVTIVSPLAGFGVQNFWLKAFAEEGWNAIRWLKGSVKFVAVSTFSLFAALVGWTFLTGDDEQGFRLGLILSMLVFGQVGLELVAAKLQLEERYPAMAMWLLLPHVLRFALVTVLVLFIDGGPSLERVALAYCAVALAYFFISARSISGMLKGRLSLYGQKPEVSSFGFEDIPSATSVAARAWPFGGAAVFYLVYSQISVVALKYQAGADVAGLYNVAVVIMTAVYIFPGVVYQRFMMSKLHRWFNSNVELLRKAYVYGNYLMLLLGGGAMLTVWLLAPFIPFIFGEEYSASIPFLMLLAVAAPVRFVSSSVASFLTAVGMEKVKLRVMGGTSILSVLLNFSLIPAFGGVGAASAALVVELGMLMALFLIARNKLKNMAGEV
ncbi:Polysaccharide biosynthesis protein [compost metagenome]